jgi:hypothetical protein
MAAKATRGGMTRARRASPLDIALVAGRLDALGTVGRSGNLRRTRRGLLRAACAVGGERTAVSRMATTDLRSGTCGSTPSSGSGLTDRAEKRLGRLDASGHNPRAGPALHLVQQAPWVVLPVCGQ